MLDDVTAAPIIGNALGRLGVAAESQARFANQIQHVSAGAIFLQPLSGQRASAAQIVDALGDIESGLRQLERGLRVIDDARRTITPSATKRSEALSQVQRLALGAIADAVIRKIPSAAITYDQLADSMPEYGSMPNFRNSWNQTFSLAAAKIEQLRSAFGREDFRLPTRDFDERLVRAIARLAAIFTSATGRQATAYSPNGDRTNRNWRPPFCQFVVDLWPLIGEPGALPPSNRRIADALKHAPDLPLPHDWQ